MKPKKTLNNPFLKLTSTCPNNKKNLKETVEKNHKPHSQQTQTQTHLQSYKVSPTSNVYTLQTISLLL